MQGLDHIWEQRGKTLQAMAFPKPHDAWKKVKEGPAPMPDELVGHEKVWERIAKRLGFKPTQAVQQRAPIIGGRRRYHHRPLTSWKLPGNKGTLTLTSDEMEAKSWNRLKGKRDPYTPRIKDVFEVRLTGGKRYWAIHHENLAYPPPDDWYLFLDTFFRWRATTKGGLKPAKPSDLKEFLEWLLLDEPEKEIRKKQEAILPFKLKQKREDKVDKVKDKIWKDPGLQDKIKWAKSALAFLKKNNIKHRDLDPSNLAKTKRGKPVITNIAESRSRGKNVGRIGKVKGASGAPNREAAIPRSEINDGSPFGPGTAPNLLTTIRAIMKLVEPDIPPVTSVHLLGSSSRRAYGLIHMNEHMRMAVLEAAFGVGFPKDSVNKGIQKLNHFANKHGEKAYRVYKAVSQRLGSGKVSAAMNTATTNPFDLGAMAEAATADEINDSISALLDDDHEVGAAVPLRANLAKALHSNPDARLAIFMAANGMPLDAAPELAERVLAGVEAFAAVLDRMGPEADKLFDRMSTVLTR